MLNTEAFGCLEWFPRGLVVVVVFFFGWTLKIWRFGWENAGFVCLWEKISGWESEVSNQHVIWTVHFFVAFDLLIALQLLNDMIFYEIITICLLVARWESLAQEIDSKQRKEHQFLSIQFWGSLLKFLVCPFKQIYYMSIVMLHIEHDLRSYIFITGIIKLPILGINKHATVW